MAEMSANTRQVLSSDGPRISAIVDQLCGMFSSTNAMHTRNGGTDSDDCAHSTQD